MKNFVARNRVLLFFVLAVALWLVVSLVMQKESETSPWLLKSLFILDDVQSLAQESRPAAICIFAGALFVSAVVGIPPPGLIALLGSAVLGFWISFFIALPGSALGALIPFLISKTRIGPWVAKRFPRQLHAMRSGLATDGAWYLFSLRLIPLVPFPVVNLLMGLTTMSARVFFGVTFFGRIPLTVLYCNAGLQLSTVKSSADILTPRVLVSLAALAVAPHIAKFLLQLCSRRF